MQSTVHTALTRLTTLFLVSVFVAVLWPTAGSAQLAPSTDVSQDTLARFCAAADITNAIDASFPSSGGVTVTESGTLQTDVRVTHQGQIAVPDVTVYVAIYPESSDMTEMVPLHVAAAFTLPEITPGYAETHTLEWEPPAHLPAGSYEAKLHVSQASLDVVPHELASDADEQTGYLFTLTRATALERPVVRTTIGSETYDVTRAGVPYGVLDYTGAEPLPVTVQVRNSSDSTPYQGDYELALHRGLSTDPAGVVASTSKSVRLVPSAETALTLTIDPADLRQRDTVVVRRTYADGSTEVVGYYPLTIDNTSAETGSRDQPSLTYHGAYQGASIACWDVSSVNEAESRFFPYEFRLTGEGGNPAQTITFPPTNGTESSDYIAVLAPSLSAASASVASLAIGTEASDAETEFSVVTQHTQTSSSGRFGAASDAPPYEKANVLSNRVLFVSIVATAGLLGILLLYVIAQRYGRPNNS